MQIVKYPNYTKNKNALLLFDFWDIKRTAIIYQNSCNGINKPVFEKKRYDLYLNDSLKVKISNPQIKSTYQWEVNGKVIPTFNDSSRYSFFPRAKLS